MQRHRPIRPATPAENNLHEFARKLGRPVARGWLSPAVADACNLNAALQAERAGVVENDPIGFTRGMCFTTQIAIRQQNELRDLAAEAIRRAIRRLPDRSPSNRIRAEAHNVNGGRGFPLTEAEVEEIAKIEAWPATRTRRHA